MPSHQLEMQQKIFPKSVSQTGVKDRWGGMQVAGAVTKVVSTKTQSC
jgi:hypothetical protein